MAENNSNNKQSVLIFFTRSIEPENKDYLSYRAKKIECEDIGCYYKIFNEKELLVFIDVDQLSLLVGKEVEILKKILNLLNKLLPVKEKELLNSANELYVFYHGNDFRAHRTIFKKAGGNLNRELKKNLSIQYNKVKSYYFTHSKEDSIYTILVSFNQFKTQDNLNISELVEIFEVCTSIKDTKNDEKIVSNFEKTFEPKKYSEGLVQILELKNKVSIILHSICFTSFVKYLQSKFSDGSKYNPIIIYIEGFSFTDDNNKNFFDKRVKFLDSSIWIRLATSKEEREQIKKEMQWFEQKEVYKSSIGQEFIDLLFKQVMIEPLPTGSHAGNVAPYHFHSEKEMQERAKNLIKDYKIDEYKWDFLLVDDFANRKLRYYLGNNASSDTKNNPTKKKLIEDIIQGKFLQEKDLFLKEKDLKVDKVICEMDIALAIKETHFKKQEENKGKDAKSKLSNNVYDIILLDYLFSNEELFEKGNPHYGLELFELIDNKEITGNRGIKNKYWIFPVSVFNQAFISEFEEKGYEYINLDWYFSPGADPINTPHLFRYKLFQYLSLQIKSLPHSLPELFEVFTIKKEIITNNKDTRKNRFVLLKDWSSVVLPIFLERFGYIFELPDLEQKSAFLSSVYDISNRKPPEFESKGLESENSNKKDNKQPAIYEYSYYQVASLVRDFLNYCYNSEFNRDRLLKVFVELSIIWDRVKNHCEYSEDLEEIYSKLQDLIINLD